MSDEKVLVKNAASAAQVKDAGRMQQYDRSRELEDLRTVLSTPNGRRLVWRLLGTCGVFQSSFSESVSLMAFHEGKRQIGLKLLGDVNEADSGVYSLMMNEARRENV